MKKGGIILASLISLLLLFTTKVNAEELGAGSVKFDKDSRATLEQLADSISPPNPFSNPRAEDKELKIVPQFQTNPFAQYLLNFDSDGQKNVKKGEKITLSGKLSFSLEKTKEVLDEQMARCVSQVQNKGERNCIYPDIYTIPALSNIGVFVQVWEKDNSEERTKSGDNLVDEFYAVQGLDLKEKKEQQVALNWQVPEETRNGSYYFSFFVTENKKFPLSGSPIAVFAPPLVYAFDISGNGNNGVKIDKSNIKLNGAPYSQILPVPTIEPQGDKINIEIPILNLNPNDQQVKTRYELYRWTQEDPKNILNSEDKTEKIPVNGKVISNFSFLPNDDDSTYTVKLIADSGKGQSAIDVHFVVKDKNRGIFLFLGVARNKDNKNYPMFCPRNAAWTGTIPGKIKLTLLNEKDEEVSFWEKNGIIEPWNWQCFTVEDEKFYALNSNNKCLKLKGEIFDQKGVLSDEAEISQNCQPSGPSALERISATGKNNTFLILSGIILLIILGGTVIYLKKKK